MVSGISGLESRTLFILAEYNHGRAVAASIAAEPPPEPEPEAAKSSIAGRPKAMKEIDLEALDQGPPGETAKQKRKRLAAAKKAKQEADEAVVDVDEEGQLLPCRAHGVQICYGRVELGK